MKSCMIASILFREITYDNIDCEIFQRKGAPSIRYGSLFVLINIPNSSRHIHKLKSLF